MMTVCPECDNTLRGTVCACGYKIPHAPAMPVYAESYASKPASQSYRARWYKENKQDYEPPRLDIVCPPFRSVGFVRPEPGTET